MVKNYIAQIAVITIFSVLLLGSGVILTYTNSHKAAPVTQIDNEQRPTTTPGYNQPVVESLLNESSSNDTQEVAPQQSIPEQKTLTQTIKPKLQRITKKLADAPASSTYSYIGPFGKIVIFEYSDTTPYGMPRPPLGSYLLVNRKESAHFEYFEPYIHFSGDGTQYAYVGSRDNKLIPVVNGKEGKPFDIVQESPIFSKDSSTYAYIGCNYTGENTDEDCTLVINGQEQKITGYETFEAPRLSSDGKRIAYVGLKDAHWSMIADGIPGPAYKGLVEAKFSDDGKTMVYGAKKTDHAVLVVNGKETGGQNNYEIVTDIALSADGGKIAYKVGTNYGEKLWVSPYAEAVVQNDEIGPQYKEITSLAMSPDGKKLVYGVRDSRCKEIQNKQVTFVDVCSVGEYPTFSPDSKHLAYALAGTVVVDGKNYTALSSNTEVLTAPIFSNNNQYIEYGVRLRDYTTTPKKDELWWIKDPVQ